MCHCSLQTEGGMIHEGGEQYHSSTRLKGTMTFLYEKHGFKWGMKNPGEWKNPAR